MKKYSYLKKYINNKDSHPCNSFSTRVSDIQINEAEQRLGFSFPNSLKEFWLEIGCGVFNKSINGIEAYDYANLILSPKEIADIILLKEESGLIIPEALDYLKKEDIPFFEIGDSVSF